MLKQGKTPFQRFLAVLCAGAMLYSMMPMQVFAQNPETGTPQTTAVTGQAPAATPTVTPVASPAASPAESQESTQAPVVESDPVPAPVMPLADPVSSIELDRTTLGLEIGGSTTLAATVTPDTATDTVTWESGDTNVVTVTSVAGNDRTAEVEAVGAGTTTITATCGGQKATCTVTVKGPATAVTIQNLNDSNTLSIAPQSNTFQMVATTEPAAEFCKDEIQWSVSANEKNITIDPDTGLLTINGLTQDSCQVEVTATAGSAINTLTLTVQKTADGLEALGDVEMEYGSTYDLPANSTCGVKVSYSLKDGNNGGTGAEINGNQITGVTGIGSFTVVGETTGSEYYAPVQKEFTVTVTPKELGYTFDNSISLSKDSDGTVQLTNANMDVLKNAFTLNQDGLVGSDAVSLDVGLTNVQYGSAAVGQTTIDLSAVKLTLTGTDAQKYTPPTVSGSIAATINPVEPSQASMEAGKDEQQIKVDPDILATFAIGTQEDGFASQNYWYGVNGVPVTLAQGCDLVAVNEDGTAGASLVTNDGTQNYFSAESGTAFYAVYNNIYYGPYTLTYLQDTTGPKLVLDEVKASKADGDTDQPGEDDLLFGVKADYTITVTDEESGVNADSVYYIVSETAPNYDDLSSGWTKADAEWFGDGYTFTVEAPESGVLYVMASDKVSNRSDENFHALVLEEDAPSLTVEANGSALNSGDNSAAYAADYALTIKAEDSGNGTGNKQSGIQKVEYELSWKTYWLGFVQIEKSKSDTLYSQDPPATLDAIAGEYLSKVTTHNLSDLLNEEEYNGEYTLTLTVYDFCGNSNEFTYTFLMDSMAPEITVTMDGGNAADGTYYYKADNCGLTVHFADDNLIGSTCEATLTDASGQTVPKSVVATEMTCDITFTADEVKALDDGTVTLTVLVTDGVGNTQSAFVENGNTGVTLNGDRTEAGFVLDTTAPVLTGVVLDPAGKDYITSEGKIYYNDTFTATFKVDEANYDAGKVASASAVTGSENAPEVALNAQTQDIQLTVPKVDNVDNAVYTLGITMEDKAGNKLVLDGTAQFTGASSVTVTDGTATLTNKTVLDTVAPRLMDVSYTKGNEYDGETGKEVYYNGSFDTSFTILDKNYDNQNAQVTVTGTALYNDETLGKTSESSVSGTDDDTYVKTVTVHDVDENGETVKASHTVYQIQMEVTDKAGNPMVAYDAASLTVNEGTIALSDRIMDNVAPVMNISHSAYTGHERYDGVAYYNDTISTTFTISDDSQDAHNVYYSLSKDGSALEGKTEVSFAAESDSNRYDAAYEATLEIAADKEKNTADGTYFYTVKGTDKAGNDLVVTSETYANQGAQDATVFQGTFDTAQVPNKVYTCASDAMDTVAPTATMSYTELSSTNVYELENGNYAYYNKDFTATFTFEDTYGTAGNSYGLDQRLMTYEKYLNGDSVEKHELGDGSEGVDAAEAKASYEVTAQPGVENDDYTFAAYGTDKAGNLLVVYEPDKDGNPQQVNDKNESYTSPYHKVLDTVAPTYTLTLSEPTNDISIAVVNNRAYHNGDITAAFVVEDVNLDSGRVKAAVSGKIGDNFNYETADVEWENITLQQGVTASGKLELDTLQATADGVYRFQIMGEDRAGNLLVPAATEANKQEYQKAVAVGEGKYWTYPKVRDTQAPVLTVNLNDGADFYTATLGEASEQVNSYYNVTQNMPYRSASSATGTLTKADCSPTSVVYSIDSTTQSQSISGSPYNYDNLSLNFSGEQIFFFETLSISDRAGNTSTMQAKTNKIYLDATAPDVDELAPTISVVAHQSGEGRSTAGTDLFSSSVTVRATVTDPGEGVRSSGLYQVYYKVLVNGDDWTDKVGVSGKGVVGQAGVLGYGTGGSEFVSDGTDQPITSQDVIDFTFDAQTFNYNDVKIYVWAEDNAGNELTESQAAHYFFGIDVTAPSISVSYDNNNAQNEKYFKEDRVATVVVTERNFDPSRTEITTETTNISGWTYAAGSLPNGDDDTWTCTVSYTEDGDYTFDVTTTDLVGHAQEEVDYGDSVAPQEFTIDKTAPIIEISFNNNDVLNGKYYDAGRTATIRIEEHNFSADGATVTTTANIQEGSVAAPAPSGWSSNGDTNTATVAFNEDGNYTMHVEFVDLAGNEAEPEDVDEFVVDTTAPELEITGVEDHMAYNGDVAPIITYHDINYDASSAVVAIQGVKHPAGENLTGTRTEDAFGGSFVCDNIEAVKENDDVYTATGSVSDMAGNETEVQIVFSVNRFGSTYMIADETQPLLDNYYTNMPQDLHVIEINVDSQVSNRVTTSLNGEVNTLQEGTDYTVSESVPGWHQYDYNILAANFTTEGVYDVTLSSEDEAGNTSSNRAIKEDDGATSDLPITFVVDMTPPVNVVTGVDSDEQYIDVERTIVVNYDDNIGMAGMILYVNDEKVAEYDSEDLSATSGSIQYTAKAANRWQTFKVVSTDLAGNTSEETTVRYLLTDNLLVQYFNNKPIFYGSLAILAALIVLIILLVKRKKQQPVNKV